MFEPKFTISNSITKALLEIERARGFLDAEELKEAWRKERDVLYYTILCYTIHRNCSSDKAIYFIIDTKGTF